MKPILSTTIQQRLHDQLIDIPFLTKNQYLIFSQEACDIVYDKLTNKLRINLIESLYSSVNLLLKNEINITYH
jgi:hypothetical protein